MKHIIIIDDEIDIGESLATVLESEGFLAEAFSNGFKAIEYMKSRRPDLLLVDVMMPKPKGVEVVRLVKEDPNLKTIPIMMMSASKEPTPLTEDKWDAFVRKPFEMDELISTIDRLLT